MPLPYIRRIRVLKYSFKAYAKFSYFILFILVGKGNPCNGVDITQCAVFLILSFRIRIGNRKMTCPIMFKNQALLFQNKLGIRCPRIISILQQLIQEMRFI